MEHDCSRLHAFFAILLFTFCILYAFLIKQGLTLLSWDNLMSEIKYLELKYKFYTINITK